MLVSCALGYSRSALVAAAWLGANTRLRDPQQVLALLWQSRPNVVLGPQSVAALARYLQTAAGPLASDPQGTSHAD
ncbi:hypothetical protein LMG23992_01806 [Cupriavidus laharis]|uniref:Tyrosine specific protein phosphatases domain-containing protein n=1 Tax=Cupriavidus laharis TaxID=151654 RepID=A0ABM8WTF5_9BURK|nr:hypothetical protein [Cupriavidus laharis]CAG9170762.1 hypothetical protein LMG23992_01806 [Cupriavidus laharis]